MSDGLKARHRAADGSFGFRDVAMRGCIVPAYQLG
jgi:hypothetical protein